MGREIMSLDDRATELVGRLQAAGQNIVFAESCTAGLLAATMGRIPGVSRVFAGSMVVYQVATKQTWLTIGEDVLRDPGPVSKIVSELMAEGGLVQTPHATNAASVTGHLGPDAPPGLDGIAWSTVAVRDDNNEIRRHSVRLQLSPAITSLPADRSDGLAIRHARQQAAAQQVLEFCVRILSAACGFS